MPHGPRQDATAHFSAFALQGHQRQPSRVSLLPQVTPTPSQPRHAGTCQCRRADGPRACTPSTPGPLVDHLRLVVRSPSLSPSSGHLAHIESPCGRRVLPAEHLARAFELTSASYARPAEQLIFPARLPLHSLSGNLWPWAQAQPGLETRSGSGHRQLHTSHCTVATRSRTQTARLWHSGRAAQSGTPLTSSFQVRHSAIPLFNHRPLKAPRFHYLDHDLCRPDSDLASVAS